MNDLDKNVEICLLLDFYGKLLTDRQREIMTLYYEDNLSLTEVAEELNISKQGVSDSLKRSEKILYETEEKLQLLKQHMESNKE
jgi:RNA polymerase sigma factor (sigma-70 family)